MDLIDAFDTSKSVFEIARNAAAIAQRKLNGETERWLKMAIKRGAGWDVWRGGPFFDRPADNFASTYQFRIVKRGERIDLPGPGVLFEQPELSEGERWRLCADRADWRDADWQDDCGRPGGCCLAVADGPRCYNGDEA